MFFHYSQCLICFVFNHTIFTFLPCPTVYSRQFKCVLFLPLLGFDRSCRGLVAAMTLWRIAGRSHLRAICALLSCDAQQRSGVAAGSPIAQLSDSPPDGGSARSLSGLLPRPGNSGKLSRHETTFGEEGEGGGTVGHTYKKIEYTKSDDLTNYIADLCGVF